MGEMIKSSTKTSKLMYTGISSTLLKISTIYAGLPLVFRAILNPADLILLTMTKILHVRILRLIYKTISLLSQRKNFQKNVLINLNINRIRKSAKDYNNMANTYKINPDNNLLGDPYAHIFSDKENE